MTILQKIVQKYNRQMPDCINCKAQHTVSCMKLRGIHNIAIKGDMIKMGG